jgi:GTP-binding protein
MAKPVVAIVGRPNVGKSTLFNRLTGGGRTAIVADVAGVTRDRLYKDVEWNRAVFSLIDTGGLFPDQEEFEAHIHEQVSMAIGEADVVLFLVDGRVGPATDDAEIAQLLKKAKRETIVVVNMVDNYQESHVAYNFLELGFGDPVPISSLHGLNIDGLLDRITDMLPLISEVQQDEGIRVAVSGRPNVGKSSLVNALLKEKRLIVSDLPGTTRDAIDTVLTRDGRRYVLVDTSGLRKRSRVTSGVEYYSVRRSLKAIDRADIALLVLDAAQGPVEQDKKIAGYIQDAGKGLIIIANKWDLVTEKDARVKFERLIRNELNFLSYAAIQLVSAQSGKGVVKILDLVDTVYQQQTKRISTGSLNTWLNETICLSPPPAVKGQDVKLFYVAQVSIKPPTFVFFTNKPEMLHFSYKRYLERRLRESYGFEGTPLRLVFRQRTSSKIEAGGRHSN